MRLVLSYLKESSMAFYERLLRGSGDADKDQSNQSPLIDNFLYFGEYCFFFMV